MSVMAIFRQLPEPHVSCSLLETNIGERNTSIASILSRFRTLAQDRSEYEDSRRSLVNYSNANQKMSWIQTLNRGFIAGWTRLRVVEFNR
jgi:hypothetical protein